MKWWVFLFKLISDNTLGNITSKSFYIMSKQFMKYPFYPLPSHFRSFNLLKYLVPIGTVNFTKVVIFRYVITVNSYIPLILWAVQ